MDWEWDQEEARDGLGMGPGTDQGWAGNGTRNRPGMGWEWDQEQARDGLGMGPDISIMLSSSTVSV